MYLGLFEGACCKLLNCMLNIAGQIYQLIGDRVLSASAKPSEHLSVFRNIVADHLEMVKTQKRPFSASLNYVLIKMVVYSKRNDSWVEQMVRTYVRFLHKKVPNA